MAPAICWFRLLLLSGFGTSSSSCGFSDQPEDGQCGRGDDVTQFWFGRRSDAHALPVVGESFAAIEAHDIHLPFRRAGAGGRAPRESGAPMSAAEEHVEERIDHEKFPLSSKGRANFS